MIDKFYSNFSNYLTKEDGINIQKKYFLFYQKTIKNKDSIYKKFRYDYKHINKLIKKSNNLFIKNELDEASYLFDVNNYILDEAQQQILVRDDKNILVIAGAGSGKTLTIIGKIRYLIERKKIKPYEILCISFTNDATISLKNKLLKSYNYDIEVLTFHKLALKIIKKYDNINITPPDYLEYIIDEYFNSVVMENEILMYNILKYFKVKKIKNIKETYITYLTNNPYDIEALKKLISKFIHLFEANNYPLEYYKKIIKKSFILKFIYHLHKIYIEELNSSIELDFDDMINLAASMVKKTNLRYKYIIIDEYQDTSQTRFNLIKSILDKTNAKLLAVGDDFQSIYRFTGCDLNIFLNFKSYFKEATILKIENTYRNSYELIKIAGNFIMKNKSQMKKSLNSPKNLSNPIKIIYYNNKKYMFKKLINHISTISKEEIMVIGRNNKDIYEVIDSDFTLENNGTLFYKYKPNIKIRYLTAHKSKGLEAENVIIINMDDKIMGFPSKLEDEKILKYVMKSKIIYPYEEERRLFYVALTRTKNNVYLLTSYTKPSIFVKEILKYKNVCVKRI